MCDGPAHVEDEESADSAALHPEDPHFISMKSPGFHARVRAGSVGP
jgi:hypothetical protein